MKRINSENGLSKVKELFDILSSNPTPIDLSDCIAKLKGVIESAEDKEIKIALLGSFSDGKTSTIAGLMGEIMDNMKIDSDESSDELTIYRPKSLKKGFVIVDTPGLFGTKEREINGENVQFSDLTIKYISEAHIVMYVTSAVAPIKESHSKILRRILRDLGKLDSTIFVLNKMDETGANIANEEAFNSMAAIKKQFLIERLEGIISLTKEEAERLKVVCIAADPKEKGIKHWLETPDRYTQLSRIGTLQNALDSTVSTADVNQLQADAIEASLNEVMHTFAYIYLNYTRPLRSTIATFKEDFDEMRGNLDRVKDNLLKSKSEMFRQLDAYRTQLLDKIANCSYEEMGGLLNNDIGVVDGKVTFYVVEARVNDILNECSLSNDSSLNCTWVDMKTKFDQQDGMLKGIAEKGIGAMKGVNNKAVLGARDLFFKGYKFKPWGAVKLAKNIGKAAVWLQAALTALDLYHKYKRNKELKKMIQALTDAVSKYFSEIFKLMATDADYFANFAPDYNEMVRVLGEREKEWEKLNATLLSVEALKSKVSRFYGIDIEDVEFEDFVS